MKTYAWIVSGIFIVFSISIGLALVLPPAKTIHDFVVLYAASFAVIHHIPLYDTSSLTSLMITQLKLDNTFVLYPYPYPPWYPLSTFFLAFLPPKQAANAWMLINAAMLLTSAALLTEKWKPIPRVLAAFAVMMFIPSIGLMVVGQYSAPILLGATLFLYAVKREDAPLKGLGLLLFTFKPHLGLFLLPIGFFWLLGQNTPFSRRTIWLALGGGLMLAALGLIADPAWPRTYIQSLLDYTKIAGVTDLGLSAGFSAMLIKLATGQGSAIWSTWLSLALIVGMLTLFWRFKIFKNIETIITACVLLTLLGDPYLLNYDYILILLPLVYFLKQTKNTSNRALLALVYFIPWVSLILERNANILYAISAILLLGLLLKQSNKTNPEMVKNQVL